MDIRKVLVVDDEPDIRRLAQVSLQMIGRWEVSLAASGAEGVARAAEERPDVILLDVMMPDMDGRATLGELRRRPDTAAIPVVFLTAKSAPEDAEALRGLGAVAVITKPFDPMGLPEQLRRAVAGG